MPAVLKIGPIEIRLPAVQAALSGYSDWPMRVIARRLGAPYTLCEVMLDRFVVELFVLRVLLALAKDLLADRKRLGWG